MQKPKKDWLKRINECEDEKILKYFLKRFKSISRLTNDKKDTLSTLGMLSNSRFCKKNLWQSLGGGK